VEISLDIAETAKALVWPLVLLAVLIAYRSSLLQLARLVGPRIKSVKLGELSLEFAEAKELRTSVFTGGAVDLRQAGQANDVQDSTQRSFFEQLGQRERLDYVVVDLGEGTNWLSSRLFILAVILGRMRGLCAIVFVQRTGSTSRQYLGVADCKTTRWRLAAKFPWLEDALSAALASPTVNGRVVNDDGRLGQPSFPENPQPAAELLKAYLTVLQSSNPPVAEHSGGEWVSLPPPKVFQSAATIPVYEHAKWLTHDDVVDILGDALDPTHLRLENLQLMDDQARVRAVIRHGGHYVAITRDDRVFHRLVDRLQLVEAAAKQMAAQ